MSNRVCGRCEAILTVRWNRPSTSRRCDTVLSSRWSASCLTGTSTYYPAASLTDGDCRFEECLKLRQLVPTDIYQFPNPPLTEISEWTSKKPFHERLVDWRRANPNGRPTKVRATTFTASILGNALTTGSKTREAYLKTAIVHCEREQIAPPRGAATGSGLYGADSLGTGSSSALPSGSRSNSGLWPPPSTMPTSENAIFSGRSVYLASDLALRPGLEEALKARVEAAGGTCWSWGVDGQRDNGDQWERRRKGEKALAAANTVVTRKREGWEFWHVRLLLHAHSIHTDD